MSSLQLVAATVLVVFGIALLTARADLAVPTRPSLHISVRREKPRVSSGRDKANPPGNYSLRPEPPGGVMEVTKSLKHFRKRPRRGQGARRP